MSGGRWSYRGGWALEAREERLPYYLGRTGTGPRIHVPQPRLTWTLDIVLADADYRRLMVALRGTAAWGARGIHVIHSPGYLYVHGLELSEEQVLRIRAGEHPLDVLLPPRMTYARALSLEEMMAR